uniref:Uncharacterized protein n=1 Tax=Cucumis sativus TaxID=3659 RepID=A0A0A0KWV3_CUCSA
MASDRRRFLPPVSGDAVTFVFHLVGPTSGCKVLNSDGRRRLRRLRSDGQREEGGDNEESDEW